MEWSERLWEILKVFGPLCLGVAVVGGLIPLVDLLLCNKRKP